MKSKKLIHELLHHLYSEREKMELTGCHVDFDLRKAHRFINEEIQNLQMMLFEREYTELSERLYELLEGSPGEGNKENSDAF